MVKQVTKKINNHEVNVLVQQLASVRGFDQERHSTSNRCKAKPADWGLHDAFYSEPVWAWRRRTVSQQNWFYTPRFLNMEMQFSLHNLPASTKRFWIFQHSINQHFRAFWLQALKPSGLFHKEGLTKSDINHKQWVDVSLSWDSTSFCCLQREQTVLFTCTRPPLLLTEVPEGSRTLAVAPVPQKSTK